MFILMGALVANAGIAARIFAAAASILDRIPGGVAATTVAATTVFSGLSGSSAADVAAMGRISVSEMRKHGYPPAYAAGVVASAGAFAALIPPSIGLILYGVVSGESIGALILAGIIPGVISACALATMIVITAWRNGRRIGNDAMVDYVDKQAAALPTTAGAKLTGVGSAALLFVIVAGGIYTGVFTVTEAAAVGAAASLVLSIAFQRSPHRVLDVVFKSAKETVELTSMIFLLLIGGAIFGYFVVSTRLPADLAKWVGDLAVPPVVVLIVILLLMVPLGMFLDGLSIMLLVVPIIVPIVAVSGYDGVWFGILMIKMIEIGLLTPPVGLNVFVMSGIVRDVPVMSIFRVVVPFLLLDLCLVALFFLVPDLVTWLPSLAAN